MPVNKENMEKYCQALESGKFEQGFHINHNTHNNTYCCLGVAQVVADSPDKNKIGYSLDIYTMGWLGLEERDPVLINAGDYYVEKHASKVNDDLRYSFKQIASLFRKRYLS